MSDLDRARDALSAIPPNLPRDQWHKVGRAAIAAGLSIDDIIQWSEPAENFKGRKDCEAAFRTVKPNGKTTAATLFFHAKKYGYEAKSAAHSSRPGLPIAKPSPSAAKPHKQAASGNAVAVWERCIAATNAEPYIFRKRGTPDGVKVYPATAEPLVIRGQNVAGYLVVPCWDGARLQTLQFIPPESGDKLNLPGASFGDGFFTVGEVTDRVFIVEGIGQAWAVNQATGCAAVVSFGSGRMDKVAKVLRAKYPAARLVILADKGKETEAEKIAAAVSGEWVAMPQDRPQNFDANDFLQEAGAVALAALLAQTKQPGEPEIIIKRSPLNFSELETRGEPPERRWAIGGWLGHGHGTLMVGPGGIGKTLMAQQMASCLALGRNFLGDVAEPVRTLVWCCEDDHDELWRRQLAIAEWQDVPLSAFAENLIIQPRGGLDNTLVSMEYSRLLFSPLFEELRQQAEDYRADCVILDNSAQLFGGNENDRHQVTSFLNNLMGALPGKAIMLLSHPARSSGSEFSGSGAWEAVVRTRLFLGSKLPDQKTDEDDAPDDSVRFLCRRKANYSSKDFRRFTFKDGVLVPDEVEAVGGMVDYLRKQRAENVVVEGLAKLAGMKVRASEHANSTSFLPRLLLEYKLNEGYTKRELADAMRKAMLDGKLTHGTVGHYGNRSPIQGLVIAE